MSVRTIPPPPSPQGLTGFVGLRGAPDASGAGLSFPAAAAGISVAVHAGLIALVASGGLFAHRETAGQEARVEVALMSAEAFAAMTSRAPGVPDSAPAAPGLPAPDEAAPSAAPAPDEPAPRADLMPVRLGALPRDPLPTPPLPPPPAPLAAPDAGKAAETPVLAAPAGPDTPRPMARPAARRADAGAPRAAPAETAREEPARPDAPPRDAGGAVPTAAGAAGSAEGKASPSAGERSSLLAEWGGKIRGRIDRAKSYPRAERAAGASGTAVLRLTVAPSGALLDARVARSSGHAALDEAALRAVNRARLPRAPSGLGGTAHTFSLPVEFRP